MPPEWLIRGVLPAQGVGFLVGAPGTGKSAVAIAMAGAIAEGRKLHEWSVGGAGGVVYAAAEGAHLIDRRFVAAFEDAGDERVRLLLGLPPLSERSGIDAFKAQVRAAAAEFAADGSTLRLVVLDTVAASRAFADDDENRLGPWMGLFGWLREIAEEHDCAVLLLHHPKHDQRGNGAPRPSLFPRGSSAAEGAADFRLTLGKRGGTRVLRVGKMRDGVEGDLACVGLEEVSLTAGGTVRATFGPISEPAGRERPKRTGEVWRRAAEEACRMAKHEIVDAVTEDGEPTRALPLAAFAAAFDSAYPVVNGKEVDLSSIHRQRRTALSHMKVRTRDGEDVVRIPDGME